MKKAKNILDHAYAVTSWALSLQTEIQADCMEQLSTDIRDLRKLVDEVVSWLHYLPCPNKKMVNKSIDEIINVFWKICFRKISNTSLTALDLTVIV